MTFKLNPLNCTDSYKLGHRRQYPENTQKVYSNLTPRSTYRMDAMFHPDFGYGEIVVYGIQGAVKELTELWEEEFFSKNINFIIDEYSRRIAPFVGQESSSSHIRDLHRLGYLPIQIKSLDEGSVIGAGIPVLTITNTRPQEFWLVNYLETPLSNLTWKPMTVATISYRMRLMVNEFARITGSPADFCNWQIHDFSCRGMSGMYDSAASGSGHLLSSLGTDTLSAVDYLEWAYGGRDTFVGGSVPATEHSVMTMNGQDGELESFRRIIKEVNPSGIVSLVADSYDFWWMITEGARQLKEDILSRQKDSLGFSKVVFRPDSGDPVEIICGTDNENDPYPIRVGAIQCLWDTFGGTVTDAGCKLLDSRVGLIYGDSITPARMYEILSRLVKKGFASANVVFGVGSYTFQTQSRDTLGLAVKATYGVVDGVGREIFKAPKTDSGKNSAKGLLQVEKAGGKFILNQQVSPEEEEFGELKLLWKDGMFVRTQSLAKIRSRLWPET